MDKKLLVFDYDKALKNTTDSKVKKLIDLLRNKAKVILSQGGYDGFVIDPLVDDDRPEAYISFRTDDLFKLFGIEIEPFDTQLMPDAIKMVSVSGIELFVIFVFEINNIPLKTKPMVVSSQIEMEILTAIKKMAE